MNPFIRGILAIGAGVVFGGLVNMGLISVSGSIIPPPPGVDLTNMESLKATMHLFKPVNFMFPFLAHALGTLAGSWITTKIVQVHKVKFGLIIGIFFLLGGISNAYILPAPVWFVVLDLIVAYIPMAWLGAFLSGKQS